MTQDHTIEMMAKAIYDAYQCEHGDDEEEAYDWSKVASQYRRVYYRQAEAAYAIARPMVDKLWGKVEQADKKVKQTEVNVGIAEKLRQVIEKLLWHTCPMNTPPSFHYAWRELDALMEAQKSPGVLIVCPDCKRYYNSRGADAAAHMFCDDEQS